MTNREREKETNRARLALLYAVADARVVLYIPSTNGNVSSLLR